MSTLENALSFLIFLDTVDLQIRIIGIDFRPCLSFIYSKLVQPLADVVGNAIQSGLNFDRLHCRILEVYFPPRARMTMIQSSGQF